MDAQTTAPALRFAPSPNGLLHLGHAYSALFCHDKARRFGGRFLLRIEDIDIARSKEHFVAAIYEDLAWLGVTWSEPVLHQSRRFADYREAAGRLLQNGLLYPCFATRTEIADAAKAHAQGVDPDGAPLYSGIAKGLSHEAVAERKARGEPFALRIDMAKALSAVRHILGERLTFLEIAEDGRCDRIVARPERWGDAVIVRKDVPASYHLAVVVDDAHQNVTHVTRGRDLFAATDLHRLLQVLLGLPEPVYQHHRLILDRNGAKLSKSDGATSLRALRARGATPDEIRGLVGCEPV